MQFYHFAVLKFNIFLQNMQNMTKSTGQNVLYKVKCIYAIKQHI